MIDPLMALNLTPVHGGLVILLGDDPGGYGSQNDQDTRPLAPMLEMPWLEPATPAEGFAMMHAAFDLSEQYRTAVVVRITRSFVQQVEAVDIPEGPYRQPDLGLAREPWRFVPVPRNVVEKHRALHDRLALWNAGPTTHPSTGSTETATSASSRPGSPIASCSTCSATRPDPVSASSSWASSSPCPARSSRRFLAGCREVLLLEENEPYLETQIKAVAYDSGVPRGSSANRPATRDARGSCSAGRSSGRSSGSCRDSSRAGRYLEEDEASERPPRENYCAGCRFGAIVDALKEAAARLGQDPVLVGDPGCLAAVGDRLDAKFAIGSAVGVAEGLVRAGIRERAVALFGDSSFFHTTMPAIANAVHHGSDILMVVLDNGATVTSGFQPNPGQPRDALGRPAPALDIEKIARAIGVESVTTVGPDDLDARLPEVFRDGLSRRGLALIVVRTPCDPSA